MLHSISNPLAKQHFPYPTGTTSSHSFTSFESFFTHFTRLTPLICMLPDTVPHSSRIAFAQIDFQCCSPISFPFHNIRSLKNPQFAMLFCILSMWILSSPLPSLSFPQNRIYTLSKQHTLGRFEYNLSVDTTKKNEGFSLNFGQGFKRVSTNVGANKKEIPCTLTRMLFRQLKRFWRKVSSLGNVDVRRMGRNIRQVGPDGECIHMPVRILLLW